jgi:hypothetical protein
MWKADNDKNGVWNPVPNCPWEILDMMKGLRKLRVCVYCNMPFLQRLSLDNPFMGSEAEILKPLKKLA